MHASNQTAITGHPERLSLKGRMLGLLPGASRAALSQARYMLRRRPAELRSLLKTVALRSVADVLLAYTDFASRPSGFTEVGLRGHRQPIRLRNGTSDFQVFRDVFLKHQYRISGLTQVEYIIDAGSNIGLASVYLLSRYPQARVIAVEPDPENFVIAAHNLAPFGERCQLIHAGLWSHESRLQVSRGTFRDGQHWATQTIPVATATTETVPAHTVNTLLQRYVFPRIDLLKVDIEGAERAVFGDGDTGYLGRTRCCAVECHGSDCDAALLSALKPYNFNVSTQGELTIARK